MGWQRRMVSRGILLLARCLRWFRSLGRAERLRDSNRCPFRADGERVAASLCGRFVYVIHRRTGDCIPPPINGGLRQHRLHGDWTLMAVFHRNPTLP